MLKYLVSRLTREPHTPYLGLKEPKVHSEVAKIVPADPLYHCEVGHGQ